MVLVVQRVETRGAQFHRDDVRLLQSQDLAHVVDGLRRHVSCSQYERINSIEIHPVVWDGFEVTVKIRTGRNWFFAGFFRAIGLQSYTALDKSGESGMRLSGFYKFLGPPLQNQRKLKTVK